MCLLKTSNGILQFLSFDWLTGNCIRAHIPLTTNFVADTRQRKQLGSSNIAILLDVFNKTIIPLVGDKRQWRPLICKMSRINKCKTVA